MEKRHVQLTGRQSFTITLPKQWITEHKIKKKQPLYMKIEKNGALLIHPKPIEENMEKTVLIEIKDEQDPDLIFRSILGYYLSGGNKMKIIGKGKFQPNTLKIIKEFVQKIDTVEITEETLNSIYLKAEDYFTLKNYTHMTKSLGFSVYQMMDDVINLVGAKNLSILDQIQHRETKINQDFWKLYHVSNLLYSRPNLINESLSKISNLFFIILNFEQMGDNLINFTSLIRKDNDKFLFIEIINDYKDVLYDIQNNLLSIINSLKSNQIEMANETIKNGERLVKKCESIMEKCVNYSADLIVLFKMTESLRRLSRNIQNVGEYLINILTSE